MKNFLIMLLLLVATPAFALDDCYSGAWFDKDRDGEGIYLEVLDGRTLGYFYTFRATQPEWFTFVGDGDINTAYRTVRFSSAAFDSETYEVGTVRLKPMGDKTLQYSFKLDLDLTRDVMGIPWCLTECNRTYIYQQLTQPIPCG